MKTTTVVNLWAGPGVGKSTNAALTFGKLKIAGVSAELVTEFAKDLVWEERHHTLSSQPYICSKQIWRVQRVLGKVDVVITDSPILLGLIYGKSPSDAFAHYLWETWYSWNTLNIQLLRDNDHHPYVAAGRTQKDVQEAEAVDLQIDDFLKFWEVPVTPIQTEDGERTANKITELIRRTING